MMKVGWGVGILGQKRTRSLEGGGTTSFGGCPKKANKKNQGRAKNMVTENARGDKKLEPR